MNDPYVNVTTKQFEDFSAFPLEGPFEMLNLLKFKDKVVETGTTGVEVYAQYMNAVIPFFIASKAKIIYQGKPIFNLIGPENYNEWDKILIIEYASKKDFLRMITAEGYPAKLRSLALQDSRLIVCTSK